MLFWATRNQVLAALVLCSCASVADSFAHTPILPLTQPAAPSTYAARLPLVAPAFRNGRLQRGPDALQMGVIAYQASRLPANPDKEKCACGSGLSYRRCCSEWHERGEAPIDPILLIKTRYSAFAYSLPEYIIATTSKNGPEYQTNAGSWETSLRDFSKAYAFKKLSGEVLGVSIEECKFWDGQRASVLFKARMIGDDSSLVEFWERAVLVRESPESGWMYFKGTLLEHTGPLQ
mmetsp:Transcript_50889/g.82298  ORF Transcript_50889/g.82298 Transcript_50889/m.82298 type:complete len:234 (+) Transcript_50889:90-791(+)